MPEPTMIDVMILFQDRQPCEQLAWSARRTLGFALERFRARIADVTLRIRGENAGKGGADQRCLLQIKVAGAPDLLLHDADASAERCVHRLARRAAAFLSRRAARARKPRRRR